MLTRRDLVRLADVLEEIGPKCDYSGEMFDAAAALRAGAKFGEVLADMSPEARDFMRQVFVTKERQHEFPDLWVIKKGSHLANLIGDFELLRAMAACAVPDTEFRGEFVLVVFLLLVGAPQEESLSHLSDEAVAFMFRFGNESCEREANN